MSVILISACSSHVPPEIRQNLEDSPSIAQVHQAADSYLSKKVRWGGVILNIENKQNASWLTILAYPLNDIGKPQDSGLSTGRFITIIDEFLEPTVYSRDRKITLIGNLLRTETIKVGEFPYKYPVVQAEQHYLWSSDPELTAPDYPPYWWYDPWYNPYYPWHHPYHPYY
ncbi:MAG: Slp family lipoprotein [Gammaproteobacteria bacterium]|nr:Slp family lipoprotein [Gammaproteobacteria bacterium]